LPSALGQQLGGQDGGIVTAPVLDRADHLERGRIGELVEPALQEGGRGVASTDVVEIRPLWRV
jgi:hypothetical protein